DPKFDQKLSWLRLLMEWQKEVTDAESFVDAVKVDIFQDEVFVFSPRGDVLNLPAGSSPVDFAYRIHTEVGHRCIGAKVNGRMVALDGKLDEMAAHYRYTGAEDFLAAVGYGDVSPHSAVMRMALTRGEEGDELRSIPLIPQVQPTPRVLVRGERGILTRIAPCCQPVPGDAITGFTTRGKAVSIHRLDCV